MQSLIVSSRSGYDVTYVPLRNILKYSIGSTKAIKSIKTRDQREINVSETISAGEAAAAKLMKHMTTMSLKKANDKPNKNIST